MNPKPAFRDMAQSKNPMDVGNFNFPNPRGDNPAYTTAPSVPSTRNVMIEDPALHGNGSIPTRYLSN